ncbi:hypothetical protein FB451DRAFT_1527180 [Mycena latifolia]|nr:hypothetical protein FB451DRAFT_1527180 [Mycena latifolia]
MAVVLGRNASEAAVHHTRHWGWAAWAAAARAGGGIGAAHPESQLMGHQYGVHTYAADTPDERSSHKKPPHLPRHHHPKTKPREDAFPARRAQSPSIQRIVQGDSDGEDSGDGDSESSDSDGHHEQRISETPRLSRKACRIFCHPRVPIYTGGGEGTATGTEAHVEDITSSDDSDNCPPPPDFVLADWIGTGRLWADDLPKPVKQARNLARRFPPEAFAAVAIPSSSLVVTDLLQEQIPDPSTHTGHAAFSREPVTPAPFDATW